MLPWLIIGVLMLTLGIFLAYLIYKAVLWVRSRDLIDATLFSKSKWIKSRPFYPAKTASPGVYSVLEYSNYKSKEEREREDLIKQLLAEVETMAAKEGSA